MKRRRLAALLLLAGCSTVQYSRVRDDYSQVDRQKTKRLLVVTAPLPENSQKLGDLWSLMARRYVNQRRNFLAKAQSATGSPKEVSALCTEGLEGVLWLEPQVQRTGEKVEAAVTGRLLRCSDGAEVWAARAKGRWPSADPLYKEVTVQYVGELGAEVEPYVGPSFRVLKAALDTLPDPVLNEQDVDEKIELGE